MELAGKLQLREGQELRCAGQPTGMDLGIAVQPHGQQDASSAALLVFAADRATLDQRLSSIVTACDDDRLTWVAYPKGGQLGTDLNRDRLAAHLIAHGLQPVRQVAIDEVWSALRFRRS